MFPSFFDTENDASIAGPLSAILSQVCLSVFTWNSLNRITVNLELVNFFSSRPEREALTAVFKKIQN